jgi:hypothetical protein
MFLGQLWDWKKEGAQEVEFKEKHRDEEMGGQNSDLGDSEEKYEGEDSDGSDDQLFEPWFQID